jgi:hypothetical protein
VTYKDYMALAATLERGSNIWWVRVGQAFTAAIRNEPNDSWKQAVEEIEQYVGNEGV